MINSIKSKKVVPIITVIFTAIFLISLFIANAFFPLKYVFAYFVGTHNKLQNGESFVRFIDVGYGDCTIVQLPDGNTLLIDCGNGSYLNNYKIIKELNACGIEKIDYAVCTSIQKEHAGGFADIINLKGADKLFCPYVYNESITESYYAMRTEAKEKGSQITFIKYGEAVSGENYFFAFLSPTDWNSPLSEYEEMRKDPTTANINNASAVMWLNIYDTNFLFAGDITYSVAKKICNDYMLIENYCPIDGKSVNLQRCNVLKVADHGHKNGLYSPFYTLTTPDYAVISVGDNARDCPHESVLAEINANSTALITQNLGDITFKITAHSYCVV